MTEMIARVNAFAAGVPLNIDWRQILLHLLNFAILFAVLYFLLYKPVKNYGEKRKKYYADLDEETKRKDAEAEAKKIEYENKLSAADAEIAEMKSVASRENEKARADMVAEAEKSAEIILKNATAQAEKAKAEAEQKAKAELADAVMLAVKDKIVSGDTDAAFESFLKEAEAEEKHGGNN